MATSETTATAIRPGHSLLNQLNARILHDLEALRDKVEGQREQQAETRNDRDGPDNCCCHK